VNTPLRRTNKSGGRKEHYSLNSDGCAGGLTDNPIAEAKLDSELSWYEIGHCNKLYVISVIWRDTFREITLHRFVDTMIDDFDLLGADVRLNLLSLGTGYEEPANQQRADQAKCRETPAPHVRVAASHRALS